MLKLTDKAKEKIRLLLKEKDPNTWGVMLPDQAGTYLHLPLLDLTTLPSIDDIEFVEDLKLVVDRTSNEELEEIAVDYIDGGVLAGVFEVKVKKPQGAGTG